MDADADNHGKEGIALSGVDAHIMEMVIIQHPIVQPLTGSAVVVNLLILFGSSWNRSVETDVPVWFCIDTTAIRRGRACFTAWSGIHTAADQRAAPFARMLLPAVSPVDHAEACHTQRGAVLINDDGVRDGIRAASVTVEVDKGADSPFLAQPVGGIVVMGGVQTDISDRNIRVDCPEFPEGDDGADAVVPSGIQEPDMQGQIDTGSCIVGAEHVKGVSEIINLFFTVPSPAGIRIREMPFTGAAGDAVFHTLTDFMPIRGRM